MLRVQSVRMVEPVAILWHVHAEVVNIFFQAIVAVVDFNLFVVCTLSFYACGALCT